MQQHVLTKHFCKADANKSGGDAQRGKRAGEQVGIIRKPSARHTAPVAPKVRAEHRCGAQKDKDAQQPKAYAHCSPELLQGDLFHHRSFLPIQVAEVEHILNRKPKIPASSPVLEGGEDAPHRIQGIGANFIPSIYDASVVDEIIPVPDDEAIRGGRELASTEGLLAGISSGAAVYAARLLAERPEFADKMIVALLPDTGERYLSTELFAFDTYPLE